MTLRPTPFWDVRERDALVRAGVPVAEAVVRAKLWLDGDGLWSVDGWRMMTPRERHSLAQFYVSIRRARRAGGPGRRRKRNR